MNYQTRLSEYFQNFPPLGGKSLKEDQRDLFSYSSPIAMHSTARPDVHDKRACGDVTRTLDQLVDQGIPLTSDRIAFECQKRKRALGTIHISPDSFICQEAVVSVMKKELRASDYITSDETGVQIVAPVSDRQGLMTLYQKVQLVMDAARASGSVHPDPAEVHMTYQPEPRVPSLASVNLNLPHNGVELMDIAMGVESYDANKQVYLSTSGRTKDIQDYISTVHALNPDLLSKLEVVFTPSTDFAYLSFRRDEDQPDPDDDYFSQEWMMQGFKQVSGSMKGPFEVDYFVDGESFLVFGYDPAKPVAYDSQNRTIKPAE